MAGERKNAERFEAEFIKLDQALGNALKEAAEEKKSRLEALVLLEKVNEELKSKKRAVND